MLNIQAYGLKSRPVFIQRWLLFEEIRYVVVNIAVDSVGGPFAVEDPVVNYSTKLVVSIKY